MTMIFPPFFPQKPMFKVKAIQNSGTTAVVVVKEGASQKY